MTEAITNGDFETGDLTGWTHAALGTYSSTSVSGYYKNTGDYGCIIQSDSDNEGYAYISQAVSLTVNFTRIQFDLERFFYRDSYPGSCYFRIFVTDGETDYQVYEWHPTDYVSGGSFSTITITRATVETAVGSSDLSGIDGIRFECHSYVS